MPMELFDDNERLTAKYLKSTGWQRSSDSSMAYWSKLIPAVSDQAAEIEIAVDYQDKKHGWNVSLYQGNPDTPNGSNDHVLITTREFHTVGDLNRFIDVLTD